MGKGQEKKKKQKNNTQHVSENLSEYGFSL